MYVKAEIVKGKAKIEIPNSNMKLTYNVEPIGEGDSIVSYAILDRNGNRVGELEPSSKPEYFRWKLCPPSEIEKERKIPEKVQRKFFDEDEVGKREKEIGIESLKRMGKAVYSASASKFYKDPTIDNRLRIYYIDNKQKKLDRSIDEKRLDYIPEGFVIKTDGEEAWLENEKRLF